MTIDDPVSLPHIQCPLGHTRLDRTVNGIYCAACQKTWPEDKIVNKRERTQRRKERRQNQ